MSEFRNKYNVPSCDVTVRVISTFLRLILCWMSKTYQSVCDKNHKPCRVELSHVHCYQLDLALLLERPKYNLKGLTY